jgi:hypothetical protein
MGVKNLWDILKVTSQTVTDDEFCNKTFAIDLAIWQCQNSNIGFSHLKYTHLRSLFYRVKFLKEKNCNLIFVK